MYGVIVALVTILLALPIAQFVARAAGCRNTYRPE